MKPSVPNPYANDSASASAGAAGGFNDLPVAQRRIMEHIAMLGKKRALADEGINIHQLAREASGGKLSLEQVRTEVNALVDEGHLYATIDDDQ